VGEDTLQNTWKSFQYFFPEKFGAVQIYEPGGLGSFIQRAWFKAGFREKSFFAVRIDPKKALRLGKILIFC